jgi:hypothetical protein
MSTLGYPEAGDVHAASSALQSVQHIGLVDKLAEDPIYVTPNVLRIHSIS